MVYELSDFLEAIHVLWSGLVLVADPGMGVFIILLFQNLHRIFKPLGGAGDVASILHQDMPEIVKANDFIRHLHTQFSQDRADLMFTDGMIIHCLRSLLSWFVGGIFRQQGLFGQVGINPNQRLRRGNTVKPRAILVSDQFP